MRVFFLLVVTLALAFARVENGRVRTLQPHVCFLFLSVFGLVLFAVSCLIFACVSMFCFVFALLFYVLLYLSCLFLRVFSMFCFCFLCFYLLLFVFI